MAITKFRYLREGVRKAAVAPETKEVLRNGALQLVPGVVASLGHDTGALKRSVHVTTRIFKGKKMRAQTAYIVIDGVRPEDPDRKGSSMRLYSHAAYHEAETGNVLNYLSRTHAIKGKRLVREDRREDAAMKPSTSLSAKQAAVKARAIRRANRKPVKRR